MKKLSLTVCTLLFTLNLFAAEQKNIQPSEAEIAKNQACFQDLEVQGCRSQEEDPEQFRACMANSHQSMDDHCKKMLLDLYGE
jgi:hypothetical protein